MNFGSSDFSSLKSFLGNHCWLLSAIIYPLSWVTLTGPNLSFLAWVAFVPLIIYLRQNQQRFWHFTGASLAVTAAWTIPTSAWLFHYPVNKWLISVPVVLGTFDVAAPFFFLYFVQRIAGFRKGLYLLPFIWVTWEWIYLPWQHTMGTHLLAYSQGNNLWLIQMADLGGMWIVAFWVIGFNVAAYLSLSRQDFKNDGKILKGGLTRLLLIMVLPPLFYAGYRYYTSHNEAEKRFQASVIPTFFEPEVLTDQSTQKSIIEQTLYRTDSLAFALLDQGRGSDLYVWPEAGTSYWMGFGNVSEILSDAVNDWSGTLLTGCRGITPGPGEADVHVSAVMIGPVRDTSENPFQYHHKTVLGPGAETIPYSSILKPLLGKTVSSTRFYTAGKDFVPLTLDVRDGERYNIGISLCYEQWFPSVWTKQVMNGAELFVHMASEGWNGDSGYQQFMANVTRFRGVENRRGVVRSSNNGLSLFIDQSGKFYGAVPYGSLYMPTAQVSAVYNKKIYSRYPSAFPIFCLTLLGLSLSYFILSPGTSEQ